MLLGGRLGRLVRLVHLAPVFLVFFLEGGDAGGKVFLDLLDPLVVELADLLELGRVDPVGLLELLLLAHLEFGDAASHRFLGVAHLPFAVFVELA